MRAISPTNLFALTEKSQSTIAAYAMRGEIAYAFGLRQRLAGGVVLDLDVAAMELVDELAAPFGRKIASTIVIAHSDTWVCGVGRADTTREPIFFVVNEYGEASRNKYSDKRAVRDLMTVAVTSVTESAQAQGFADHPKIRVPDRVTWINLSSILRRVRMRAAKIGLDFSAPFFPPETDPAAQKLLEMAKKDRRKVLAWIAEQNLAALTTSANTARPN